jgi:hypothetical protein
MERPMRPKQNELGKQLGKVLWVRMDVGKGLVTTQEHELLILAEWGGKR